MTHVLLTPPGQPTTLTNLGIVQSPCDELPDVLQALLQRMSAAGYTVTVISPVIYAPAEDAPARQRGQQYIYDFLQGENAHDSTDC